MASTPDEQALSRSKLDAKVVFVASSYGQPHRPVCGPYDAVVDLYEHRYGDLATFWYGVAEIACSFSEIEGVAKKAELDKVLPSGFHHHPANYSLRFELADGRWGIATQKSSQYDSKYFGEEAGDYSRVAFMGVTTLATKPEGSGHRLAEA